MACLVRFSFSIFVSFSFSNFATCALLIFKTPDEVKAFLTFLPIYQDWAFPGFARGGSVKSPALDRQGGLEGKELCKHL
jgi:hypothetical protein